MTQLEECQKVLCSTAGLHIPRGEDQPVVCNIKLLVRGTSVGITCRTALADAQIEVDVFYDSFVVRDSLALVSDWLLSKREIEKPARCTCLRSC